MTRLFELLGQTCLRAEPSATHGELRLWKLPCEAHEAELGAPLELWCQNAAARQLLCLSAEGDGAYFLGELAVNDATAFYACEAALPQPICLPFDRAADTGPAWAPLEARAGSVPRLTVVIRAQRLRDAYLALHAGESAESVLAELQRVVASPEDGDSPAKEARREPSDEAYLKHAARLEQALRRGDYAKVVLAQARSFPRPQLDTQAALKHAHAQGEAHLFALGRGAHQVLGASPERLLRIEGDALRTEALAGTLAAQGASRASLDDKVSREQHHVERFILDTLGERGLSPRCGTRRLRRYGEIVHPVTEIQAEVSGLDTAARWKLVQRLHPTPAVCGAPRDEAYAQIRALEGFDRGYYAGAIGWRDGQGRLDTFVALRLLHLERRELRLYVGAGLVAGSVPHEELAELDAKARATRQSFGLDTTAANAARGAA